MPKLASAFCQVCWVVRDIAAAERFFVDVIGVKKFMHFDRIAAKDTAGTYHGKPGDWVFKLYLAYAGDTQIELIQHVSGGSIFAESLRTHGNAVQHVAYWLDDADYDAHAQRLEAAGYSLIQGLTFPLARIGYFDTRPAIGVVTELVGANEEGHKFRRNLKDGNF